MVGSDEADLAYFFDLKEVVPARAVMTTALQAAPLETGGPIRTGTDRCGRASR
jgi:hypothetical protein